jgi:D-cysteine desulfhydrase
VSEPNAPPDRLRHPAAARRLGRRAFIALGLGAAGAAVLGGGGASYLTRRLNAVGRFDPAALHALRGGEEPELFRRFPGLADAVPWRPLGRFPTPVEELHPPGRAPGVRLLVKRDDLCSTLYGGNKVRKLEHLLAEAALARSTTLVTVGGFGSNHALATALHGRAHGFRTRLSLYDQPVTPTARTNLRAFLAAGAELHYAGGTGRALLDAWRLHGESRRAGEEPYFIMVGGSSRLGNVGHVGAALELAAQVRAGVLPEPDRVFVPLGTCGTAAGLIAGLKIAGLRTRVSAVRVADPVAANARVLRYFAQDVADYLHDADAAVPRLRVDDADFDVLTAHFGDGYALPTAATVAAVEWATPALRLDTTYSGKAMAACLDHCRAAAPGETVLFWNTLNSAPVVEAPTLDGLPPALTRVFAE